MHLRNRIREAELLTSAWQKSSRLSHGKIPAALLTDTSLLSFAGPDVLNFLQGYLTCDLGRLEDGGWHFCALTNLKGRVVATGWCRSRDSEHVDWVIHRSLGDGVAAFMRPYLAFAKTELQVRTNDHIVIGIPAQDGRKPTITLIEDEQGLESLLATHHSVDEAVWQSSCINEQFVLVSADTSEQFLPQMLGLVAAGAIDFDKGCYLGQEVVARAQHRGQVKRSLIKLTGEMSEASAASRELAPGDSLTDESAKECGTLVSVATISATSVVHCLAVVRQPPLARYLCSGLMLAAA